MSRKILIDGRFIDREATGVSRYTREIIRVLSLCPDIELTVLVTYDSRADYTKKILTRYSRQNHLTALYWYSVALQRQLKKEKFDIFHSPAFSLPVTSFIKKTVTIHDLTPYMAPESMPYAFRLYLKNAIANSVRTADIIFTVSETVKKELVQVFGNAVSGRVKVWNPLYVNIKQKTETGDQRGNYIFFIGNSSPRKNLDVLLKAFMSIQAKYPDMKLKIAGFSEVRTAGKGIEYLGYVDENKKTELYKKALVFIWPSLYEGFGIPIHEAFSHGTPVIASDIPVHRETAGDGAVYFNPRDPDDLEKKLSGIIQDGAMRHELILKGGQQLERYGENYSPEELWKIFLQL